jgi:hypothetical protein
MALAVEALLRESSEKRSPVRYRSFCRSCGEDFAGDTYFDRHRIGTHDYLWSPEREDGRRCLDADEMLAVGLRRNAEGRWYDPESAQRLRGAHAR